MLSLTPSPISRSIPCVPHSCKRAGNVPRFPGWDLGIRGPGGNYCGKFDSFFLKRPSLCSATCFCFSVQNFCLNLLSTGASFLTFTKSMLLSTYDYNILSFFFGFTSYNAAFNSFSQSWTRDVAWVEHKISHMIKRRFSVSFVNWTG